MKVLVSWMDRLRTYVSREFYYIMRDLIRVHGWRQVEPSVFPKDPAGFRAALLDRFGEIPEVILFWETFDLCIATRAALMELGCHVCIFADDLHWRSDRDRERKLLGLGLADSILSTYAYGLAGLYPELSNKKNVSWIPHSASPDFALPFNDRPQNAILLSGAINGNYPLRERMKRFRDEGRYPIRLHEHPGYSLAYDYSNDTSVGAGYAKLIHRYKVAFTDALWFKYVVAKYFEIPAVGTLLLADSAVSQPLEELGFLENVHYIPASRQNLEQQIEYVLEPSHDVELDEIRRRGQELVLSRHRTSDRATRIAQVCTAKRSSAAIG